MSLSKTKEPTPARHGRDQTACVNIKIVRKTSRILPQFEEDDPNGYETADRMLHGVNAFQLAARDGIHQFMPDFMPEIMPAEFTNSCRK
jgi:hypothetical protein